MKATGHVILDAMADLLREVRLALKDAVLLRVRSVVAELPLGREEALPLPLGDGDYRLAGGRYPGRHDHSGLLAWSHREREFGYLRGLYGVVQQHLRKHRCLAVNGRAIALRVVSQG